MVRNFKKACLTDQLIDLSKLIGEGHHPHICRYSHAGVRCLSERMQRSFDIIRKIINRIDEPRNSFSIFIKPVSFDYYKRALARLIHHYTCFSDVYSRWFYKQASIRGLATLLEYIQAADLRMSDNFTPSHFKSEVRDMNQIIVLLDEEVFHFMSPFQGLEFFFPA